MWEPSRETVRRSEHNAVHGLARRREGPALRRLSRAVAVVHGRPRGFLGRGLGLPSASRSGTGYGRVLADDRMPGANWFPDAAVNYAENALAHADDLPAVISRSELRPLEVLTYGRLRGRVAAAAAGLRRLGVGPGDRVAAYMPNIPETLVAFLATSSIGAVWSVCSPEFGTRTVVDRFRQVEPKVLIAVDGYVYGGRRFDRVAAVNGIRNSLPSVERTVIVPYLEASPAVERTPSVMPWSELMVEGQPLVFEQVALRPPAVGAVLVRHYGVAQAHRAGPRRHPAGALQGALPPHGPGPGRPVLLVHDDGLDDVEPADRRSAGRLRGRPFRRRPGPTRTWGRCGNTRATPG